MPKTFYAVWLLLLTGLACFPASANAQNLVENGDFESGNTGFDSDYTYVTVPTCDETEYSVVSNPNDVHGSWLNMGDHTTGGGQMFVANGSQNTSLTVWQTAAPILVTQVGTPYRFEAYVASVYTVNNDNSGPSLAFQVWNGSDWYNIGASHDFQNGEEGQWFFTYYDGKFEHAGTYYLRLVNNQPALAGNDLGVDDIYFGLTEFAPSIGSYPYDTNNVQEIPTDPQDAYTVVYVDASVGASGAGTNWATAFKTIQEGVDAIALMGMVWVTNGVYDAGGAVTPGYALTNRVCITKAITVQSVNGPEVTFIAGAPGSNGSNDVDSIRGVFMNNGVLDGFTITNGYTMATASSGDGTFELLGGGVWVTNATVSNCVITGNMAYQGGGGAYLAAGGAVNNCAIEGNVAVGSGGGVYVALGGALNNARVTGNVSQQSIGGGIFSPRGEVRNCTVANNTAFGQGGGVYMHNSGNVRNCVVWNNTGTEGSHDLAGNALAGVAYTCASDGITHGADGNITNNPLLEADFRLSVPSPAVNAGNNIYAPTNVSPYDLAGNPRINRGVVDMGAYEMTLLLSQQSGPLVGGNTLTVTNSSPFGTITNVLVDGVAVAEVVGSGTDWFTVVIPSAGAAGAVDIVVQTSDNGAVTLADVYTYNPAGHLGYFDAGYWEEVAGRPVTNASMAYGVLKGKLITAGGDLYGVGVAITNAYSFDGSEWTEITGLPVAQRFHAGASLGGKFYSIAGFLADGSTTNLVFAYDGEEWTSAPPLLANLRWHSAATVGGDIYVVGGDNLSAGLTNAYRFDGSSWTEIAGLPAGRAAAALTTQDGQPMVLGGRSGGWGTPNTNVYLFDGSDWIEQPGLPEAREKNAAAELFGRVFALGGLSTTNVWWLDGSAWTEVPGLPMDLGDFTYAVAMEPYIYAMGNLTTNVFRYYPLTTNVCSSPTSGGIEGGFEVTISDFNLGNGSDITNVTLCGVSVTNIASQSATQVVVWAGLRSGGAATGDVVVFSTSYGITTQGDSFSYTGQTTQVVLYDFYMQVVNGEISVCWQTASEENSVGFDLFRWDGASWEKVNGALIPSKGEMGGSYSVADALANAADTFRYKLVEYETGGGVQEYGPFDVAARNPRMENISLTPDGIVLRWLSREQDTYEVQRTLNLLLPLEAIATGLPATPPVNVYTDEVSEAGSAYYRVRVEE